jgi:hypothetical protein
MIRRHSLIQIATVALISIFAGTAAELPSWAKPKRAIQWSDVKGGLSTASSLNCDCNSITSQAQCTSAPASDYCLWDDFALFQCNNQTTMLSCAMISNECLCNNNGCYWNNGACSDGTEEG